jgi:heavy metal translocating P-type ATPase
MSTLRKTVEGQKSDKQNENWIEHLLDAVEVRSLLKGRIRFHLGFFSDEAIADTLRRELQKIDGVKLEAYSTRTRNALVIYDPKSVTSLEVATAFLRGVREYARLHGECDLEHHRHERSQNHSHKGHGHDDECDHDHSSTSTDAGIRKELLKLAMTGGVLGYFLYKKVKGKPIAFYGNPLLDVASIATIASGYKIFRAGVDSVQKQHKATDDTLISLAVIATLLMGESITGLSVVWLINLGRLLEAITLKRSRTAIKELMDIAPKEAWLVQSTSIKSGSRSVRRVAVEQVEKGQALRIFHSEKVPLDGRVIRGQALVREAFITGEAIPKEKRIGDSVYAGSLVESGDIDIEVTNLVHDTVVAQMIDAIENVRERKAPIEKIGTRFASQFVPISLGISGVTLLLTGDLRRAITMLVIACPCAAGLATPTAVSASIGQAARKGILIKGGTHIETAACINTVIFDKTGTLTEGKPILQKFLPTNAGESLGFEECLRIAASAEQHSTHPLGLALVGEAKGRGLQLAVVDFHKSSPGLGISSGVEGRTVQIGNQKYIESLGMKIPSTLLKQAQSDFVAGESIVFFSVDQQLLGAFIIHDSLRPEAPEMLERLRSLGIERVILASGDQKISVDYIARRLGISETHAELLPQEKLKLVSDLKASGLKVAMVGDGINDAQALAEAELSIAMGGGHCDVAIEAADVTLARNDLLLVPEVLDISQKTLRTIYQNFAASVGINAGGLVLSAVGRLSPFSAAIVHNASTIAVVLNSLRLGRQVAGNNPLNTLREVKI